MSDLPVPPKESIFYEDEWLYVCLALYPLTKGHTVVVWKKAAPDLKVLSDSEYDYLMEIVDIARDILLDAYSVEKVYLVYMDETKRVHWHLVPRYDEMGANILAHDPPQTDDFSKVPDLRERFSARKSTRALREPARS